MNGRDTESGAPEPGSQEAARAAREQRLAAALRENLKRRKSRLRERRQIDKSVADPDPVKINDQL